ncbi:AraC family transcriptional regulator [Maridesulfovibrio salexigens]|uniref:Transcriptional regulator, AraC family n=1 Tax=Maridesulfovibrio salexigens (strain ATCC 14822 / DSM 2638 / NCIMB 8403 / VKM B-1763) TaxID=526222 RepID=C6BTC3_MARSD|nr:AraC family transcriptional regulator [Maridesulfovibrio salexigens]ACS81604.1 transcriptional regulator, AraC family [Maridesulfovibrio salexigens DSM 2638]
MSELVKLLEELATEDGGAVESRYKGVRFFKETEPVRVRPMIYNPGICIVASGYKMAHIGGMSFRYDAENYLVTSVAMPLECESFPSEDEPLLGLYIDIDMAQLNDLINQMNLQCKIAKLDEKDYPFGVGPSVMSEDMKDAAIKLLKALRSETEAKILAPGFVREIYYRVLCGSQAPVLYSLARGSNSFSQVARVISIMEGSYDQKFDVQQLADSANMSVSAFHKAFKEITADSPLQYLKKIRLSRAKDLIIQERMKAYLAADKVGYDSPSQFSREFKRYFGQSPADVIRETR